MTETNSKTEIKVKTTAAIAAFNRLAAVLDEIAGNQPSMDVKPQSQENHIPPGNVK
jgi:hypothetical protein